MNLKKLILLLFVLNIYCIKSIFVPSPQEIKLYQVFQTWMEAYEKNYDETTIQEKFENFKDNYESISKTNSLNQAPITEVYYQQPNANEGGTTRKLFGIESLNVEITLPLSKSYLTQSLNKFSDLSNGEFISYYTGLDTDTVEPEYVTGNEVLNNAEISGIIIGSVVGGLGALLLFTFIARKIYLKNKLIAEEKQIAKEEEKIKKVFKGINLYDFNSNKRCSITARGVPIEN